MVCPNPPPAYSNYPPGTPFSAAYSSLITSASQSKNYPSYPTPLQGECLQNCPFIAALQSVAWTNRNFIINYVSAGPLSGSHSFSFWDYPAVAYPPPVPLPPAGSGCQINSVAALGTAVQTQVVVSDTIALDYAGKPIDPNSNMYYGAGSSNTGEIWPSLYEKAYAKFCLYKNKIPILANNNMPLQSGDLTDPTKDPLFSEIQPLTKPQWGGNAGIGLMYLTGLPCWTYSLKNAVSFSSIGGLSCGTQGNIYPYIRSGFCYQTTIPYGVYKTRYPLVAWTYTSEAQSPAGLYDAKANPTGIQYSPSSIMVDHCYPILGVYEPTISGATAHYIVLGTTFGRPNPDPNVPVPNYINIVQAPNFPSWNCFDGLFPIGAAPSYPPAGRPSVIATNFTNGIFGIEGMTTFQKYFAAIGWAQGY
jgi:hypothetical protein